MTRELKLQRELEPFFDAANNVYIRLRRPNGDERADIEEAIPTIIEGIEASVVAHLDADSRKLNSAVKVPRSELDALRDHLSAIVIGGRFPDGEDAILPDDYLFMVGPTALLLLYAHLVTQQLLADAGTTLEALTSGNRTGDS